MVMLQNKIDIVHIHYSYDEQIMKKTIEEITKIMMDDINPVILEVLKNGQYNDTIFLGKSLGTIPIDRLSNSNLKIDVVQNANHSLDIGEFEATNSILVLSKIMERLQETISSN
jgi:hypothetical protein